MIPALKSALSYARLINEAQELKKKKWSLGMNE